MLKGLGLAFLSIIFAGLIILICNSSGSDFPTNYAKDASIGVLGTILALNVATATFLIGSLLNIEERVNKDIFDDSRKEIKENLLAMAILFVINIIFVALATPKDLNIFGMMIDQQKLFAGGVFAVLFFYVYLLMEIVMAAFKIRAPKKK